MSAAARAATSPLRRSPVRTRRRTRAAGSNSDDEDVLNTGFIIHDEESSDPGDNSYSSSKSSTAESEPSDAASVHSKDSIDIEAAELFLESLQPVPEELQAVVDIRMYVPVEELSEEEEDCGEKPSRRPNVGVSILHEQYQNKQVMLISFDFETGGNKCFIIQISAVITKADGSGTREEYNSYVKPPASAKWNKIACENLHDLHKDDPRILEARTIETVWPEFVSFIEDNIPESYVGLLVAWNGQACDLQWIYRLTKTKEYNLDLPERVDHFMDPYRVIKHYKGCELNPNKSKLSSLALSEVYEHVKGVPLTNAHDSLYDSRAQLEVILHRDYIDYLNKSKSVIELADIWNHKINSAAKVASEPTRPVVNPWKADNEETHWKPPTNVLYDEARSGGPPSGPSQRAVDACRESSNLFNLFSILFATKIVDKMAEESERYSHNDWIIPADRVDRDGVTTKRQYWKNVSAWEARSPANKGKARHRAPDETLMICQIGRTGK